MTEQLKINWGVLFLRATLTIFMCALLAVPLNLFVLTVLESIYDRTNDRIVFSDSGIDVLRREIWSAVYPFEKPDKFPARLLAGAAVGSVFTIFFGVLGERNWIVPIGIGCLFLVVAIVAYFVAEGANANFGGAPVENILLLLAFVIPAIVLWFILRMVWR